MENEKNPFELDVVSIRLVKDAALCSGVPIRHPEDAVKLVGESLCEMDREVVCVINLKTDGTPINCTFASVGSLEVSVVNPREIFKASILSNASSMILIHNHPSGNLTPSSKDVETTDRMKKACDLMGISLLDHIIVGGDNSEYFSFQASGMLSNVDTKEFPKVSLEQKIVAASKGRLEHADKKENGLGKEMGR